jgi:hypothetical protein
MRSCKIDGPAAFHRSSRPSPHASPPARSRFTALAALAALAACAAPVAVVPPDPPPPIPASAPRPPPPSAPPSSGGGYATCALEHGSPSKITITRPDLVRPVPSPCNPIVQRTAEPDVYDAPRCLSRNAYVSRQHRRAFGRNTAAWNACSSPS